jgi:peroxiredoxin
MAKTPSTMLPLGTSAPDFSLPDTDGKVWSLASFKEHDALLVMFICNHCPYVKLIADELAAIGRDYGKAGVGIAAINSNDAVNYPDDSPAKMRAEKAARGYSFPYLFDESQAVAKAYQAACTPDFYLFNKTRRLVYRGQLDDARPGNGVPVTGRDLRLALDLVRAGLPVPTAQQPSIGCNIKWRPGVEPNYR